MTLKWSNRETEKGLRIALIGKLFPKIIYEINTIRFQLKNHQTKLKKERLKYLNKTQ